MAMCPKGVLSGESGDTRQKSFRNPVLHDAYDGAKKLGIGAPPQFGDDANKTADYVLGSAKGVWSKPSDIEDSPRIYDGNSIGRNQAASVIEKYDKNSKLYMEGKGIVLTVTGSRNYENKAEFAKMIEQIEQETGKKVVMIQQGGARGADSVAAQYAYDNGLSSRQFDAHWGQDGLKAGVQRNSTMVRSLMENKYAGNDKMTLAIFNGNVSAGTADMLKKSILTGANVKYTGIDKSQYRDFVLNQLSSYAGKTAEGLPLKGAQRLSKTDPKSYDSYANGGNADGEYNRDGEE
jgi:hypothetical protein